MLAHTFFILMHANVAGQKPGVAPPVTPKGRGGSRTKNLMIILKILRICNINSKINLKTIFFLK
jgi:hypothetical protein